MILISLFMILISLVYTLSIYKDRTEGVLYVVPFYDSTLLSTDTEK